MNASAFYDVLVIGGGASGLAAAITAARVDKRVCVVERDVACGLKLLATGNGRCNLSNESIDIRRYNRPAFVESIMGPQPEQDLESFFSSLGIMTIREEGRLYPRSLRAESVRDALLNACERLGITLLCGTNVIAAHKASEGWTLQIDRPAHVLKPKKHGDRKTELRSLRKALADTPRTSDALQARAVVIATGGNPTGIAEVFSLPLTPLRPVLCPVSASVVGDRTHSELWMVCASEPLNALAQPRRALARRWRSAVPCLRHLRRRRLQSLSPYQPGRHCSDRLLSRFLQR